MHPADMLIALRFLSRLPVPVTHREIERGAGGFVGAAALVPVAGAIIGFCPAAILVGAMAFGLPPLMAAPIAVASALVVTGALHEDGLADCADGFGGGRTRDRKLDIMRDSRIGTYGACAISLSLYLRAMAIGSVATRSPALGAAVIVAAAAVSRALCLMPLAWLPAARQDGLGVGNRPAATSVRFALGLAVVVAFVALGWIASPARIGLGLGSATAAAWIVCLIARHQIGGQTGDVAGATQQLAELGFLLVFAAM